MTASVVQRVSAGVEWLDANDPGWWRTDQPGHNTDGGPIDLDELSMASTCYCVLGQRFGNYFHAPITVVAAGRMGFDAAYDSDRLRDFEELRAEWVRVITERRAATPAVV